MYFVEGHQNEYLMNTISNRGDRAFDIPDKIFVTSKIGLKVEREKSFFSRNKSSQSKAYGYLNFSFANSKILLVVHIHPFESISRITLALHEKNNCEAP